MSLRGNTVFKPRLAGSTTSQHALRLRLLSLLNWHRLCTYELCIVWSNKKSEAYDTTPALLDRCDKASSYSRRHPKSIAEGCCKLHTRVVNYIQHPSLVISERANHNRRLMSTKPHSSMLLNHPQLLNVTELAAMLKVKPRTIYEMVAQNRIPYRKPPGSNILRFDLDEIITWTKAGNNK